MTNDELDQIFTEWGIVHRGGERNHNYYDHESIFYKIEKWAVQLVNFHKPTTLNEIMGELVGENKVQVGADSKQIDIHMVIAIDNILASEDIAPFWRKVARAIYIDKPKSNRKNPDMILQASKELNVGVQVIKTARKNLFNRVNDELELIY